MLDEVIEKLAIAEQFAHNAQYAGVARQAVADGYSCIDAVFSALLIYAGDEPPRNHKQKLDKVKSKYPDAFEDRTEHHSTGTSFLGGVTWERIESFYREWLTSRYEKFVMEAGEARQRVAEALRIKDLAMALISDAEADPTEDTLIRVQMAAFGYQFSEVHKAVGLAHDHLFHEAEIAGEMRGSKLGTKMAAATNFCDADFLAGDEITRKIIEDDDDIAGHAADVYIGFVRLSEEIRLKRLELLSKDPEKPSSDEINASTNFMLSLKAKYHGEPMLKTAAGIVDMLTGALARSLSKNKDDLH